MSKKKQKKQRTLQQVVDKTAKHVENFTMNCGKSVDNHSQTAKNSTDRVEKTPEKVEKTVDKPVQNTVEKAPNSSKLSQPSAIILGSDQISPKSASPVHKTSKDSSDTVIKVANLYKSFRLPTERAAGLKQAFFNWLKGIKGYTEHQVLRGVSFEVKKGEFIGIVGRNGSGKSTLLKLLAQIYYPEQGSIEVNGVLVPFIELGVGFNPELTGRENVYLNGALLGFSHKEMDQMYEEIVQFAELEQFMDAKLKNYSSGMQVRLAFSIAIRAKGDILILDEVLAVGDAEFQKKCNDYFASLHGEQTVILVTHSMENVRQFCDRAILIENGEVATEGNPDDVAKAYEALWD